MFKISPRLQWTVFAVLVGLGVWMAHSYQMYSVSDRIISYQERKLGETRSAYVDLMSDFVTVHKNISALVENFGKGAEKKPENVDEYLKRAEVIEEKIRQITAQEDWINEKDLSKKSALKDALIHRDVAIEEKKLLEQKVAHLEEMVSSLQAFEMDILKKVESISNKDIDKIKTTISSVNGELKKRGKYFNPLANSKKNSKGGVYIPDNPALGQNEELMQQVTKTFTAIEDSDADHQSLVEYSMSFILKGDTMKEIEFGESEVQRICRLFSVTPVRENWIAQATFFNQFPGYDTCGRTYFYLSRIVSLAVSFEQLSTGLPRSDWGEGAITLFRTMSGSPYRFQFHISAAESAVAHCCIVGPTGQGKTTLLTFLAGQAMRHGDLKVYFFDRHRGAEIFTHMV